MNEKRITEIFGDENGMRISVELNVNLISTSTANKVLVVFIP